MLTGLLPAPPSPRTSHVALVQQCDAPSTERIKQYHRLADSTCPFDATPIGNDGILRYSIPIQSSKTGSPHAQQQPLITVSKGCNFRDVQGHLAGATSASVSIILSGRVVRPRRINVEDSLARSENCARLEAPRRSKRCLGAQP